MKSVITNMSDEKFAQYLAARQEQVKRFSIVGCLDVGEHSLEHIRKADYARELKVIADAIFIRLATDIDFL